MLTRTEKRRQDAILADWLVEHQFKSIDAFLDSYYLIQVTNPQLIDDLLDKLRSAKTPV